MAHIITTDNLVALDSPSVVEELTGLAQNFEKLQLKINKEIKFSNKKNWIKSIQRRKNESNKNFKYR